MSGLILQGMGRTGTSYYASWGMGALGGPILVDGFIRHVTFQLIVNREITQVVEL